MSLQEVVNCANVCVVDTDVYLRLAMEVVAVGAKSLFDA